MESPFRFANTMPASGRKIHGFADLCSTPFDAILVRRILWQETKANRAGSMQRIKRTRDAKAISNEGPGRKRAEPNGVMAQKIRCRVKARGGIGRRGRLDVLKAAQSAALHITS